IKDSTLLYLCLHSYPNRRILIPSASLVQPFHRTEGKVQAWAKVRGWTRHTIQARVERRRKTKAQRARLRRIDRGWRGAPQFYNQASDSDRHQEGDATGRAIGPGTGPRTQSIAERRRTEGGVGEKREEGNGEMRTYCTKAAVSGTSLYGSRPRPRVSARPEGEERRWLPEPDTGEGEGCGCIGTPGVTIAGTSLYGSRPHPQGAELWSAEHREAGRLLRRGYRKRMVARVRSTTKRGREGRTTGLLVVRRRRSNPQRAGGLRRAKPGGNTGPRGRPLTIPWRMLSTAITVILGVYKAVATYSGQTLGPATVDWVIGIVWTLIIYWVSFFDDPTSSDSSWFFTLDISTSLGPWILIALLCVGAFALYRYASDAEQLWIGLGFGLTATIVAAFSDAKPAAAKPRRRRQFHE
ncbi:hypothetical protein DFH06DRAFT_1130308, partial [Mycena polygramma]